MNKGIYKIVNKVNGKVYYGSSKNLRQRFIDHRKTLKKGAHHSSHLQKAWKKYGKESFEFIVVELVENENLLIQREQQYLDKFQSYKRNIGYNMNALAASCLDRKTSERTRKKISENHADVNGKNNPMYGRKHTEEAKKRIAQKAKESYRRGRKAYRDGKVFSSFKFFKDNRFIKEVKGQKQAKEFCKKQKIPFQTLCKGKSEWNDWKCKRNKKT